MKTNTYCSLMLITLFLISSCGKNNNNENAPEIPEAKPAFDNNSFGVYKGVFAGSSLDFNPSGSIKIVVNNGDNNVKAYIRFTQSSASSFSFEDTLTSTSTFIAGQNIDHAWFLGKHSAFSFSVEQGGSNPQISSFSLPYIGSVSAVIEKESSNKLILCYQGSYKIGNNKDIEGIFNFIIAGDSLHGMYEDAVNTAIEKATGSLSDKKINAIGVVNTNMSFSGDYTNKYCSGTWKKTSVNGTWLGVRIW